jgi:Mrp family chromosome partitioning ATPase
MSKNALIFERTASGAPFTVRPEVAEEVPCSRQYSELIRRQFHTRSAVAIMAVGSDQGTGDVCPNIAAELAASGNRVVIVSIPAVLRMNPVATLEETDCMPGRTPNVWLWPSTVRGQVEFFKSRRPADPTGNWLDSLRSNFDSILMDCPAMEIAPTVAELAALADAAILVVEAGRTTKKKIRRDKRALQSRGVKLAGCVLIQRR